ncbi:MAG TPA: cytoplasmic protein [Nitrospiria bacterium]|nr:cytoplasmic protein [Nitrospiria bacterium]
MKGKKIPGGMIPPGYRPAPKPRPTEGQRGDFDQMQASLLFCNKCQRPMPVRERLLLVLPDGNLFEYRCQRCGNSVGERTEKTAKPSKIIL